MSDRLNTNRRNSFICQDRRCYYCRQEMWLDDPLTFAAKYGLTQRQAQLLRCTAEHLRAKVDGGGDDAANIVAACFFCNTRRHKGRCSQAPNPSAYRVRVAQRMACGKWHPVRLRRAR